MNYYDIYDKDTGVIHVESNLNIQQMMHAAMASTWYSSNGWAWKNCDKREVFEVNQVSEGSINVNDYHVIAWSSLQ